MDESTYFVYIYLYITSFMRFRMFQIRAKLKL